MFACMQVLTFLLHLLIIARGWREVISSANCLWKGKFIKYSNKSSPSPRVYHSAAIHNDTLIVYDITNICSYSLFSFGGHVPSANGDWITQVRNDLWECNLSNDNCSIINSSSATGTWTRILELSHFTESPGVLHNGIMYIFAGFSNSRINQLLIYDAVTKKMIIDKDVTGPSRSAHSAVVYQDSAYIFGGYSGFEALNQLVKFNFGTFKSLFFLM